MKSREATAPRTSERVSKPPFKPQSSRRFDYSLDYSVLDLREDPRPYRVGLGEQGVLLVEPYKSEILPLWKFKTPSVARASARAILRKFMEYDARREFIGMDMCRKFLQMGFTRSRRYANRRSGRKYAISGEELPLEPDLVKAKCASIFYAAWQRAERHPRYQEQKRAWIKRHG